jgi:hypothetical protein
MNAPPLSNPTKCELHTSPDDFHHTAPVSGCSCYERVIGGRVRARSYVDVNNDLDLDDSGTITRGSGVNTTAIIVVPAAVVVFLLVSAIAVVVVMKRGLPTSPLRAGDSRDVGEWDDSM